MAYDFLFKTQVPINCSMTTNATPALNGPTTAILGTGLAILLKNLLAKSSIEADRYRTQRDFRTSDIRKTQEMPVVSSRELMVFQEAKDHEAINE